MCVSVSRLTLYDLSAGTHHVSLSVEQDSDGLPRLSNTGSITDLHNVEGQMTDW